MKDSQFGGISSSMFFSCCQSFFFFVDSVR
jgi:hypothetical protein